MSFKNNHMAVTEAVVGLRTNVALKLDLTGITWDNAKEKLVGNLEYGWTRFTDLWIIMNYIKCNFNCHAAANAIGYSATKKSNGASSIQKRLERINTVSFIAIIREMFRVKLLTTSTTKAIITKQLNSNTYINANIRRGKFYRFYTKLMVTSALEKFPNMAECASKLGVEEADLQWWLDENVENILVSAG